ncbi:MAG: FAD binding domain-containing protein [Rhodoglobus sp.]
MDLITVRETRVALTQADLVFGTGETPLGGGTWLFSEPQPGLTGLVDLTRMPWPQVTRTDPPVAGSAVAPGVISIAGTCPIAVVRELPDSPLFQQCADSLLASWKILSVATVAGNIATSLPAGPMTSLAVALDATLLLWTRDGQRRVPAAGFVTGVQANILEPGEVIRAIDIPVSSLHRAAFRRIALSPLGRTGTLVIGRVDATGQSVFTVSGGTTHPHQLRFATLPAAAQLEAAVDAIDDWYDDAHGAPDWRQAMSRRFALELHEELCA